MKVRVDENKCIGCGICESMSSELFEMNDEGKAQAIKPDVSEELEDDAMDAQSSCPVNAIKIY